MLTTILEVEVEVVLVLVLVLLLVLVLASSTSCIGCYTAHGAACCAGTARILRSRERESTAGVSPSGMRAWDRSRALTSTLGCLSCLAGGDRVIHVHRHT